MLLSGFKPLDEVMLAMDVVDTLRRRDRLVQRELDVEGREQKLSLSPDSLAFTYCQVPVVYERTAGGIDATWYFSAAGDHSLKFGYQTEEIVIDNDDPGSTTSGGTSDFSLIRVESEEGELGFRRIAVGDHLLLGGDNMDLALAHRLKGKLAAEGIEFAYPTQTVFVEKSETSEAG